MEARKRELSKLQYQVESNIIIYIVVYLIVLSYKIIPSLLVTMLQSWLNYVIVIYVSIIIVDMIVISYNIIPSS